MEVFLARQLNVLGPPEVLDDHGNPVSLSLGKPLALLIYVACSDSPVSRDDLADLLWPGADRQHGRHSVRQALWVLKTALGEDVFANHDPLSLRAGALETDLQAFSEALAEGRVDDARGLWRGPVLDHFVLAGVRHWNRWTEELGSTLEARFTKALLQHARILTDAGSPEAALSALDEAVAVTPASEVCHRERIQLLLHLLRLDAARKALSDAHKVLGEAPDSVKRLNVLDERLETIALEQRSRVSEGESFPMEFVGRSRELAGLHNLWRDVDQGRTRVAVITGPSGIGKTRLAEELLSYVSGAEVRAVALKGTKGESTLRWGGAADLVRQLLRLPGSAGISSASDSLLRAMLPSMGRDAINLQTTTGVSPAAILDATTDLLEATTFEHPLAVLVDDFQWVDPDSRTLFTGLANRCREQQVFFLILGRSDLTSRHWETVEAALVEEAGASRFVLESLIEEEVGELLALGATFPDSEEASGIVRKIHRATGGNPLFIREVLKELHQEGILRMEGPGWVFQTSELPEEFELPENIRVLLRERMDRLSEPGAYLAATLATEDRARSSEFLQTKTQLPSNVFTQALTEVLEGGVIEWVNGSSLDFVHDLLREIASRHLVGSPPETQKPGSWFGMSLGTLAAVAVILFALPLGVLWGTGNLPWGPPPDPPLYGGGEIIFRLQGQGPYAVEVSSLPPEDWTTAPLDPPPPEGVRHIFPSRTGGYHWFGAYEATAGPDMTVMLDDGSVLPLFPDSGDQTLYDLHPDGSQILFVSENLGSDPFSASLYRGWPEDQRREMIYEGHGHVSHAHWSPAGDLLAFSAHSNQDTLIVSSVHGERLGKAVLGNIHGVTWCGESLVVSSNNGGEAFLIHISVPEMTQDTLLQVDPGLRPTCSPDGSALAYMGVLDRRLVPLLFEIETGQIHRLPMVEGQADYPQWHPPAAHPFPVGIRIGVDSVRTERDTVWIEVDTVRIGRGQEQDLKAWVLYSDGTKSADRIQWESLDPTIATMGPYLEVTGNGVGQTSILGRWGYSLVDTLVVEVEDRGPQLEVFEDDFSKPGLPDWRELGSHPGVADTLDGNPVLRLQGDEKYADGLISVAEIELDWGITVEMEFRFELTRSVHQNFGFCLRDVDLEQSDLAAGTTAIRAQACVHYPARDLQKFDPSEVSISTTPGLVRDVRVPEVLPTGDWIHIALQVRVDGVATIVLNRERIASAPVTLQNLETGKFHLVIQGDAVGTEVFVRNLTVWPGERY